MPPISGEWEQALRPEFRKPYYRELFRRVGEEYRRYTVYPPADDIFNAFHFTPLPDVRVVILGQDPYHEEGQAHGLSFSVRPGIEIPPSLVNIYQELPDTLGGAGRASSEYRADSAGTSGKFPPGHRLGRIYRCGDPDPCRTGTPARFHPLGKTGAAEGEHDPSSGASGDKISASQPFVGVPRFFRKQAVFPCQQVSGKLWTAACRLEHSDIMGLLSYE